MLRCTIEARFLSATAGRSIVTGDNTETRNETRSAFTTLLCQIKQMPKY